MAVLEELRTFVLTDAAVLALVADRMTFGPLPQNSALPAITYLRAGGLGGHTTEGASQLRRARFQFDCWGATFEAAEALANAVRTRIDGYRNRAGVIRGIFLENEIDRFEAEPKLPRVTRDYQVWFVDE